MFKMSKKESKKPLNLLFNQLFLKNGIYLIKTNKLLFDLLKIRKNLLRIVLDYALLELLLENGLLLRKIR
jgi:hypothetical protein